MPNSPKTWSEAQRLARKQARKMTADEDARLEAGIEADPDAHELDDAWFAKAKPARGRPRLQENQKKKPFSLRLSTEVIERFKASGPGYQTRMAELLERASVADHVRTGNVRMASKAKASKPSTAKGSPRSSANKSAGAGRSGRAAAKRSTRSSGRGTSRK